MLRNYFLGKFFIPLIIGMVSTKFEAIFGKLNFWRKFDRQGPYKNSENFVPSYIVLRNYFLSKFLIPLIKGKVSTKFKAIFGKLNFWWKFDMRDPYKNSENFVLSSIVLRNLLLVNSYSTHQRKGFYKIWGNFWKIEFLTEIRQGPYKNSENLVLS